MGRKIAPIVKFELLGDQDRGNMTNTILRGAGTGGAGGAITPPTFGRSIRIHSNSTTNIFG